jgi:pimeloyl-ACP methyl ester carboxylesterase
VQREVSRVTRVCAYDRAGSGWSDPSPRVAHNIAEDLHALLEAAGEKPPYIMVGASAGALYVRLYQARYPAEVPGLVLVDPSSEDRLFTLFEGKAVLIASLDAEQLRSTVAPRDVNVPRRSPQTGAPFDRLPEDLYATRQLLDARLIASVPETVPHEIVLASAEHRRANLARLKELRAARDYPLESRPLVVLTRGTDSTPAMVEVHATLAKLSRNSRHTVVPGAGHEIHLFEPRAVIEAITDVIEAARRSHQPLPAR